MKTNLKALSSLALASAAFAMSGCHTYSSETIGFSVNSADASSKYFEKSVVLESDNGEFSSIHVLGPVNQAEVEVREEGTQVVLTAFFSSDNAGQMESFIANSTHSNAGGQLEIHIGGESYNYHCALVKMNGAKKVGGLCLEKILIQVPAQSRTRVFVGAKPVVAHGGLSIGEVLAAAHAESFDDQRVEIVRGFAAANASRGRYITVADVVSLMRVMDFDDKRVAVAQMFSGHVVDRENAYNAGSVLDFDSNKVEAIRLLSQ